MQNTRGKIYSLRLLLFFYHGDRELLPRFTGQIVVRTLRLRIIRDYNTLRHDQCFFQSVLQRVYSVHRFVAINQVIIN